MPTCLIGLGSNLGDRRRTLEEALARLGRHPQVSLSGTSGLYETPPIGGPEDQPPFVNAAAVLQTSLPPLAVLKLLQEVESQLGRRRQRRWGPRTIDLDLLLYDQQVLSTPTLELPHPRMAWRRFVLEPASEVAGWMIHPPTGWTIAHLLDHLNAAASYVAITGPIGAGKTRLAQRLARDVSARLIAEPVDMRMLEAFYADRAGRAWETELEFLACRVRLLAADSPEWSDRKRLVVSDFWFDQSLAFARAWLPPDRLKAYEDRWRRLRGRVVRPKLIVLLDVSADKALAGIRERGRACEANLSRAQLERIRRAVVLLATQPGQGPLLRLTIEDPEAALREARAAVQAMQ